LSRAASRGLERLLGAAFDHVQQPGRPGPVPDSGEIDDDGDELVAATGVPPDVFIDADDSHSVEPAWVGDQDPSAFGQDRIVGGVPGHPKGLGDPGDRQVLTDNPALRTCPGCRSDLRLVASTGWWFLRRQPKRATSYVRPYDVAVCPA